MKPILRHIEPPQCGSDSVFCFRVFGREDGDSNGIQPLYAADTGDGPSIFWKGILFGGTFSFPKSAMSKRPSKSLERL